jgi:hypothetical protein
MLHTLLPKLLTVILSWIQAATLRERYYLQQQRIEILETAIDDIQRINRASSKPNPLISNIIEHTIVNK